MKRAFYRAQKLYDLIKKWLRKLHLKLVTLPQKLRKIWEKKTGILNNFYWPPCVFLTHLYNYHDN